MDGKTGAEELINQVLQNPALLKTLASAPKPEDQVAANVDAAQSE